MGWIRSLRDEQGILQGQVAAYLEIAFFLKNRVGGKRNSFSPTFVFRPLTPNANVRIRCVMRTFI